MSVNIISLIRDPHLQKIAEKVIRNERIEPGEGLYLYTSSEISALGLLATYVRTRHNGNQVYYVRNFHIEPTNKCIYHCKFCSYSEHMSGSSWEHSIDEMLSMVKSLDSRVTELHITGGVHPQHGLEYYCSLLEEIKKIRPDIHLKAYSAIEIDQMARKARLSYAQTLEALKKSGLDSIPGGGAEIFDEDIRKEICPDKGDTESYLKIHAEAHRLGIPSNATMLYGHIERYAHRIDHMERLRRLQDSTAGFNGFIPLKYKSANNGMSGIGEVNLMEDLKNYAVSRIYLDNFKHLKAYWPMIGKEAAGLALSFGVDDLDGTIEDSTRIYTMAGVSENNSMSPEDLIKLAGENGLEALERDALYQLISRD